jgi:BASS family bile acid:Na+ symporter
MPLFAVILTRTFGLRASLEIELVALAISPVPPLLPGREGKAGGHASYGLGLMATVAILSIAVVPLGIQILGRVFGQPLQEPPAMIAAIILKSVLLPLTVGMAVRAILPDLAARIAKPSAVVAKTLLAGALLVILVAALPEALTLIGNGTLVAMVAFVLTGLAIGHSFGGPRADDRVVLALSTASRHPGIALAISKMNFPDEKELGATILLYLLVNALVGLFYMTWLRRGAGHVASAA